MKRPRIITAVLAALVLGAITCHAQTSVVITAFEGNGQLTFNQIEDGTEYAVEWASSLNGPWTNTWQHLTHIPTNPAPTITVAVPMFYRIVANVVQPTGSVQVTLAPAGAVSAGAQWSVDGGSTWHNSGFTRTGLPTGAHTVTFKTVTGWDTPTAQGVTVNKNQTTTATGTYVQQTGSLQMTLTPAGAVSAGAQWSIDGGSTWHNSAYTRTGLPVGSYTVTFKNVTGFVAPSSQSKDVTKNQTTTGTGVYTDPPLASDMVSIAGGTFTMGDSFAEGFSNELPTHSVTVNSFYMSKYMTTKGKWDEVRNWAVTNGYTFSVYSAQGWATNHPVYNVTWHDILKWCNARSEKEGRLPCYYTSNAKTTVYRTGEIGMISTMVNWTANGYRLPTEAEWEYAARGGFAGRRFPWGDLINHGYANYFSTRFMVPYDNGTNPDTSIADRRHPAANTSQPCTTPVGYFAANGFGLYDMIGNMWEYVWDRYDAYPSSAQSNPLGPDTGAERVQRGGQYDADGRHCRSARRNYTSALTTPTYGECFRVVIGQ